MTKFLLGFTLALLLVAIVIIAFMAAPNTRPPNRSKRQSVETPSKLRLWRDLSDDEREILRKGKAANQ